eukprot:CAMPEP_0197904024 /NCGR_PEP_ID=MMETSP1439-20131203/57143_1 /TAXON_ID=66791 /ORGANISM="Gonyaulax spinifera, Strain CCMP409" /LENGTH=59 /DNA_ID=CAMNT_0043525185 /DNA_START=36 /DNA_END=215 /DNA_ORIENTATION=+
MSQLSCMPPSLKNESWSSFVLSLDTKTTAMESSVSRTVSQNLQSSLLKALHGSTPPEAK